MALDPVVRERSLFSHRGFRIYWIGGMVSNVGTWLQNVTASVVILDRTHSPFMVGVLGVATFAPMLALSMVGGALSDRFDRRRVVVVTQSLSLVVAAVMTLLAGRDALTAPTLIALSSALGCSYALAKPALSALLPGLVDRRNLAEATAVNSLQFNIGQVAGSALSALLLSIFSPAAAFAVNTFSFAGPIVAMHLLRREEIQEPARKVALRGSARDGLRFAIESRVILALLVGVALSNASTEVIRTLAPTLASSAFGTNSSSAGVLVTSYSIGATVGLLAFPYVSRRTSSHRTLHVAFVLQTVGVAGLMLSPGLVPAIVCAIPIGIGFALNIPVLSAALQLLSPDEMRGRVMSMFSTVHIGLRPLFSVLAGALATVLPVRASVGCFVLFPLLGVLIATRSARAVADTTTLPASVPTLAATMTATGHEKERTDR